MNVEVGDEVMNSCQFYQDCFFFFFLVGGG